MAEDKIECTTCTVVVKAEPQTEVRVVDTQTGHEVHPGVWLREVRKDGWTASTGSEAIRRGRYPNWILREETTVVEIRGPKPFEGSAEEAQAAGWVEGEHGWQCPDCVGVANDEGASAGWEGLLEFAGEAVEAEAQAKLRGKP